MAAELFLFFLDDVLERHECRGVAVLSSRNDNIAYQRNSTDNKEHYCPNEPARVVSFDLDFCKVIHKFCMVYYMGIITQKPALFRGRALLSNRLDYSWRCGRS